MIQALSAEQSPQRFAATLQQQGRGCTTAPQPALPHEPSLSGCTPCAGGGTDLVWLGSQACVVQDVAGEALRQPFKILGEAEVGFTAQYRAAVR